MGIKNVVEVNAFDTAALEKIVKEEVAKDEVSCVAIGTGKSLDNLDMLSEGAINLSRERKVRL